MTDDIVARLRNCDCIPHCLCGEAADEIERLRLELAIPRHEYAREWKTLLDRIEHLDILEWIRAYAAAHSPSDYVSPIAREVIVRSDKKLIQAADEIERLRRELGQVSDADSWVSKADAAHLDSLLNWCEFNHMESHRALQRLVNDRARLRGEVTRLRAGGCSRDMEVADE